MKGLVQPAFALRATARQPSYETACRAEAAEQRRLEATPGIEPGYADLQSAASPLRHVAKLVSSGRRVGHAYIGAKAPRQSRDNRRRNLRFPACCRTRAALPDDASSDREPR